MPSVTKTTQLGLSQDEAFGLATDPARFEEWLTLHKAWPNGIPSATEPGSQFVQTLSIMGMPANVDWTVAEYSAPSRFALTGAGPMGAQLATTITAGADGSVSYQAEFSGGTLDPPSPMGEMVTKKAGEELDVSLAKLKALAAVDSVHPGESAPSASSEA